MEEKSLILYVSAAPEMDVECELLGQTLARLTQLTQWTIKRTPAPHEHANPDLATLRRSHFYLILLGSDIVAPIGVEWMAAREAQITLFAFRRVGTVPTPAAAFFAHNAGVTWERYTTPQEFIRRFERALITQLVQGTPGYGLHLAEIESLAARLKELEQEDTPSETSEERRGAGRGGVILPTV
jgi:hypothetical protein